MHISHDLSFHRTLALSTYEQLGQLLQQMAQVVGNDALVLTETVLPRTSVSSEPQITHFTLLLSQRFNALLIGEGQPTRGKRKKVKGQNEDSSLSPLPLALSPSLNVSLTFEPEAIAPFLFQLSDLLQDNSPTYQALCRYRQTLQPNDSKLQSKFTLLLLSLLVPEQNPEPESLAVYPQLSVCQPVEDALRYQIAQEQLLNQVNTQIRQSMELPLILRTAIEQVRDFLQVDRLVIYQFEESKVREQRSRGAEEHRREILSSPPHPLTPSLPHPHLAAQHSGYIAYETRSTDSIPSVLNYKEENCFAPNSQCWQKYRQGLSLAIDNVEMAYGCSKCLLGFLKKIQVRAKLVAPIVLQEKLWGLLIAHQCTPRHWLESEKNLLRQIAEQMAIAINQAQLMRALTQEKQTLEQRVIEHTQALRDALSTAQAASRAKSEFLARMSHELRSPLTSVIGMSSTLLLWHSEQMNTRQRHYLQTIHDSGKHLLDLINDILELSQLEAGKTVLNISEFSLVTLAEDSFRSFADKANQQAVNLKIDLKITPPNDLFTADQQRVQQILWNLLSNAIKFTPEAGEVILRVWREKDTAIFQVEDTGIGIPEEQLPLIFEKFQQLDQPYCRLYEGTGLGLALTKQLVELHRGRIEVESSLGVGSIFTVWLEALPN